MSTFESTFDPTLQKKGLPPIGTRVRHHIYGDGTVMHHDNYVSKLDGVVQLNRLGITFDDHKLFVKPAFFDHDAVTVIEPQA